MDERDDGKTPKSQTEASMDGSGSGRKRTRVVAGNAGSGGGRLTTLAQDESRDDGHNFVGTEQILLAILKDCNSRSAELLNEFGVTYESAKKEVRAIIGTGSGFVSVEIPFTPRAKRALELSWAAARDLGHNFIGIDHLMLGVIDQREGLAVRVLENHGVNREKLRLKIRLALKRVATK